jgi:hypothetical protein
LKAVAQDVVSKLPPTFQANPLAPTLAKALVTINRLGMLLQAKAAMPANGEPVKSVVPNANPSAAAIAGDVGSAKKGEQEVTMDDFRRAREGW